ncbi:MAG: murein biosynthesis integral membrane protein MurJ [Proteobacteria bacterium]|nr:murein biosynthesis integral membrane protein MurJ [Pseudomonadota bacterium]
MKDKNSFFIKGFTQSAIFTLFSRITGFIRDIFIATFLGAGVSSDIFFIAFKLPNLFRRITAEGALTSAVVPIYSKLKEQKNKLLADKFLKTVILKLSVLLCIVVLIFQIMMPFVVYFLAPGFSDDDIVINNIIMMTRITIFFMPLISIVALLGVATNVSGRFWALSFTPIILNSCIIISCFFIKEDLIIKSLPLAIATVLAGIFQLVFMLIIIQKFKVMDLQYIKNKIDITKDKNEIKIYLKQTWNKFLPAAFGGGVIQVNLLVDTILASLLGFGSISYLYYADRIAQLPLGIIGIALGSVLLTSLSKSTASKDKKQFSTELIASLKIGIFFSIPAAVVFINFSELFIKILFERGEFTTLETIQTSQALIAYSIGIPAFIILKSCQPAFFALGDTKTPLYIGFLLLILNIVFSLLFMYFLRHAGIALATSMVSWFGVMIYIGLLVRNGRIAKPNLDDVTKDLNYYSLLKYLGKIIIVSLIMLVIMKLSLDVLLLFITNKILILFFLVSLGLVTYALTTYKLGYMPEQLLNFYISKFKKA